MRNVHEAVKDGERFLERVSRRWPVKVLSVVAAIILFVFHRMGDLQERFFSVPLRVETSNGLVPASSYPRNIKITLRGDATSIYPVVEGDIEAYLDLTRRREPGFYKAAVLVRKTGTAAEAGSLEILVEPMEVSLELDAGASKSVPLKPVFQGSPENGYELVSYTLDPDQMVIEGPRGLVASISQLETDPIDLESRNADFSARLRVKSPQSLAAIRGGGITEFNGIIKDSIMIRSFDDVPLSASGLGAQFGAEITPPLGSVRIEGIKRHVEVFEPPENFLSVDLSLITGEGTYTLPVTAALPEDFTLSRLEPQEVTVTVSRTGGGAAGGGQ